MAELPLMVKQCISMSLRNRSTASGRAPDWLNRAADIRYVGHQGNDQIELLFEAPTLGDSACEIYEQKELFDELSTRPSAKDTGFDLLGDVLCDVKSRNTDSDHFDSPLLTRLTRFGKVFEKSPFRDLILTSRRHTGLPVAEHYRFGEIVAGQDARISTRATCWPTRWYRGQHATVLGAARQRRKGLRCLLR
jgi:hypothetical protein